MTAFANLDGLTGGSTSGVNARVGVARRWQGWRIGPRPPYEGVLGRIGAGEP
jgi:hypothetical protein